MKCPNCGKDVFEEAISCWYCNVDLRGSTSVNNSSVPTDHSISTSDDGSPGIPVSAGVKVHQHQGQELVGVRGWLLYLCISVVFLSPILMLFQFISETLGETNPTFIIFNVITTLGPAVYSQIIGIRLWLVKPKAVHHTKVYFLVMGLLQVLSLVIVALSGSSQPKDYTIPIRSIISIIIWLSYLSKSKRVALTFGLPYIDTEDTTTRI